MQVAAEMRSRRALPLAALLVLAGCANPTTPAVQDDSAGTVAHTIEEFNDTAAGSVTAQKARLAELVSPGQAAVQSRCPTATSTISFQPVYARLTPTPDWKPTSGTLPGTVYALPTLIRVYTGDRITGTDLTDLHVSIEGGRAWLPALCLT
jgi:hypothetical protein